MVNCPPIGEKFTIQIRSFAAVGVDFVAHCRLRKNLKIFRNHVAPGGAFVKYRLH